MSLFPAFRSSHKIIKCEVQRGTRVSLINANRCECDISCTCAVIKAVQVTARVLREIDVKNGNKSMTPSLP